MPQPNTRSGRLDAALSHLLEQAPEIEAAAVVSFDGLPMASALPAEMDEDRVAAMSAALLSLGERASEGLGRGELSQVYIEGASGTVFLVSADGEAVLVAVAVRGAKVGMMLFEVRRAATEVAAALRDPVETVHPEPAHFESQVPAPAQPAQFVTESFRTSDFPPVAEPAPAELHSGFESSEYQAPAWAPSTPGDANPWS